MNFSPAPVAPRAAAIVPLMVACSSMWASSFLFMKHIGHALDPMALTALRGLMGAAFVGLFMLATGQSILPRGREWRDWSVLGLLFGFVPNSLTVYALGELTVGLTSMIQASTPLLVALLASMVFADERMSRKKAAGLFLGFTGMVLLIGPKALDVGSASFKGVTAMVAAAISYAVGNVYVRSIPQQQSIRLALGQQSFAGIPTFCGVMLFVGPQAFAAVPDQALWLLALGTLGTAVPIVLFMNILRMAGPTLGSMNGYFTTIWTVVFGAFLLSEPIVMREVVAVVAVLCGVGMVSSARRA